MSKKLFPADLADLKWLEFPAEGFSMPVSGVIYREHKPATNGVPLGGIDTGCIDLETTGLLGYASIFNSLTPRRGPFNVPFLGLQVDGKTHVLAATGMPGVTPAKKISYWGHYPVADIEFELDAPVNVGLRALSSFIPGDVEASMIPGAVFELHLRNTSDQPHTGKLAATFPGYDRYEVLCAPIRRHEIHGEVNGGIVTTMKEADVPNPHDASYFLGVLGDVAVRLGKHFGWDASAWREMGQGLPPLKEDNADSGISLTIDWSLAPGEEKIVRVVLAWHAPVWYGSGLRTGGGNGYTHMYVKRFANAYKVAVYLAQHHQSLLQRVLAWQAVVYAEQTLPVWLRDSLVNILHLITETSVWAQAKPPIGDWCREEDGVFGLNECPRSCPQIECIPCSLYGNLPIVYFFPKLALSTLRAERAYQFEDGRASWMFGGSTGSHVFYEMAEKNEGYQYVLSGSCLVELVDKLWQRTGDNAILTEFYEMCKRTTVFTMNLRPDYGVKQVVSMPTGNLGEEWYESAPFYGLASHVGGIRLAHLRLMQRMAESMDDKEFTAQCAEWLSGGSQVLEEHLWAGTHYRLYHEPETGKTSDVILAFQLDGEWISRFHGLPGVFREERVATTLGTLERINANPKLAPRGTLIFANPDGTKASDFPYGYWTDSGTHTPGDMILAMTYMYAGQVEFGMLILHRLLDTIAIRIRATWDSPILFDTDTAERIYGNDYYQNMMLWSVPAVLAGEDLAGPCKPGGLADRMIKAGNE